MTELEEKTLRLRRLKFWATLLFILMVILFFFAKFLSHHFNPWVWKSVAAFAEAGMIGALADWYAVTALFKHPMGIKIPHTNLLAKKKDKFAIKMSEFIGEHFLNPIQIEQKLENISISAEIGKWLKSEEHKTQLQAAVVNILPSLFHKLDENELNTRIHEKVKEWIESDQIDTQLFQIGSYLLAQQYHQKMLDMALDVIIEQVNDVENRQKIQAKVKEESPRFLPSFIGKAYTHSFLEAIEGLAIEVKEDNQHSMRVRFDEALKKGLERWQQNEKYAQKIVELKQLLIQQDFFIEKTSTLWTQLKSLLLEASQKEEFRAFLMKELTNLSEQLVQSNTFSQEADRWMKEKIRTLVLEYRPMLMQYITQTIQQWDNEKLSHRMELEIGKDLQYIRINGTLVGGLVGLLLYWATELIPQWLPQ